MSERETMPAEHLDRQPGIEAEMATPPRAEMEGYAPSGRLAGRTALVTGGDSGIGRAVAIAFAKEGADVAVSYLDEHEDAGETRRVVERQGRRCVTVPGDIGDEQHCREVVRRTVEALGGLDVLVNNAAEQHQAGDLTEISAEQLERTFRTNVFGMFFMTKAALPHMGEGSAIVNTTSVTAYKGKPELIDYSATKGAIVAFTRSLSQGLAGRGIRVNAVAPGPVWTPLIPATFDEEQVRAFGAGTPLGDGPAQPAEIAPSYVFLASRDSSQMTGQVLHPNGGTVVAG